MAEFTVVNQNGYPRTFEASEMSVVNGNIILKQGQNYVAAFPIEQYFAYRSDKLTKDGK